MTGGQKYGASTACRQPMLPNMNCWIIVRPGAATRQILGQYTGVLVYALPVIFILMFVVGYFCSNACLRLSIRSKPRCSVLTATTLTRTPNVQPGSELEELSASLNQAFGSLQDTVDRERLIVAEASTRSAPR